ncbi:MAG: hypothetical protein JSV83_16780 [Desulfobacterales bacterium]|nr:MAG: hypothetical protein JSV83_16780 [Desulfobacterales bacterium]
MQQLKHRLKAIALLLIICLWGCGYQSETAEKTIDFGEFEAGVYTNTFFDLAIAIPEDWYVLDAEARNEMMRQGSKVAAGDNRNLKAALNAADLDNLNLLAAYEHAPGTPVSTNPGIMVIAEKVKHMPGIKQGRDYHYHSKKMMQMSNMNISFTEEIYEELIDDVPFDVMEMQINVGNIVIMQKQYVTIMNGYALLVGITYQDEEGLYKLQDILQTMSLS